MGTTIYGYEQNAWRSYLWYETEDTPTQYKITIHAGIQGRSSWSNYPYKCALSATGYTTVTESCGNTYLTNNETKRLISKTYTYTKGTTSKTVTITNKATRTVETQTSTISKTFTVPALAKYTVSFNANGGTGAPSSQTKYYGKTLTLSSAKPTRTGYTFKGWSASSTAASAAWAAGGAYTANAGDTLYAVWQPNTYTYTFNANGGTGGSAKTVTYGTTFKFSSVASPTKTGYIFKGWADSSDAAGTIPAESITVGTTARTFYAVWELAYMNPKITSIKAYRCSDAAGMIPDDEGLYARVEIAWAIDTTSSVSRITATVNETGASASLTTISADLKSGANYIVIGGALSTDNIYNISVMLTDSKGKTAPASTYISRSYLPMDVASNGLSISFGEAADDGITSADNANFKVNMNVNVKKTLKVKNVDYTLTDTEISTLLELLGGVAPKLIDYIYPVGSVIYSSNGGFNPNDLYSHQTWERIKDRFILAAGDTYLAGSMGGEAKHVLTAAELPSHTHTAKGRSVYAGGGTYTALCATGQSDTNYLINSGGGEGAAHNNMPPYKAVYVWERTA